MASVVVENLSFIYPNGVRAINDITFSVEPGSIVAYLGPNGSGKTTTVDIMTTVFPPAAGRVTIGGYDVVREKEKVREIVSVSPQEFTLDLGLTVEKNLDVYGRLCGMEKKKRRQRISQLLEAFELSDKANVRVLEISGGQGRRLQVARALLAEPQILFLDEPTLGLDPFGVRLVLEYLRGLRNNGVAIFLASNEMEQVEELCNEIIFLNKGRIVDQGKLSKFMERHVTKEVISILSDVPIPSDALNGLLGDSNSDIVNAGNPLVFEVKKSGEVLPKLIERIASLGITIKDIETRKSGLREVFMQLTEEANQNG